MYFFSHKSCLQLKGQNLQREDVTSSLTLVRVLPLCRGVPVGSVPEVTVGAELAAGCWKGDAPGLGSLHCQWREGVTVSDLPMIHLWPHAPCAMNLIWAVAVNWGPWAIPLCGTMRGDGKLYLGTVEEGSSCFIQLSVH